MNSLLPAPSTRPDPAIPKLLIYNPSAGRRPRPAGIDRIRALFAAHGWTVLPHPTRGPQSGASIVSEFRDIDGVIVLGGDGTVNEVLPAVAGTPLFLAVLPGGTANVVARELGMPPRLSDGVAALVAGEIRPVTLGEAGGRLFLAMAGVGFDARVVASLPGHLKRNLGKGAFALTAIREWRRSDFPAARFEAGGDTWEAPFGVVANTSRYGGGFRLAPQASLEAPELDLCLFLSRQRGRYLGYAYHILRQDHPAASDVLYRKVDRVEIAGDGIPFQVDGELSGLLPVTIRCLPAALRLLFPGPRPSKKN